MGLFLSMSGVVGKTAGDVETALSEYTVACGGSFKPTTKRSDPEDLLVLSESAGNTTILYPGDFMNWDEASAYLSQALDTPTFSFHVHDGDLWMYILFVAGEPVDQFNPIPDYWDDSLSDEELQEWKGNPATISHWCPHVQEELINKYLVRWDLDDLGAGKAYEDDEFTCCDWQLVDFMRKLGFVYPVDDKGGPIGGTYVMKVKSCYRRI